MPASRGYRRKRIARGYTAGMRTARRRNGAGRKLRRLFTSRKNVRRKPGRRR